MKVAEIVYIAPLRLSIRRTGVAIDVKTPEAKCRICGAGLRHTFVDLGASPLCESYLDAQQLNSMEPF